MVCLAGIDTHAECGGGGICEHNRQRSRCSEISSAMEAIRVCGVRALVFVGGDLKDSRTRVCAQTHPEVCMRRVVCLFTFILLQIYMYNILTSMHTYLHRARVFWHNLKSYKDNTSRGHKNAAVIKVQCVGTLFSTPFFGIRSSSHCSRFCIGWPDMLDKDHNFLRCCHRNLICNVRECIDIIESIAE